MFGNDLFLQHCFFTDSSSFVDCMTLNLFKMLLKLLLLLTLAVFELLLVKLVDAEHSAFSNSLVLWRISSDFLGSNMALTSCTDLLRILTWA